MKFNLSNTKAADEGRSMTEPGTIAVFAIEEIKYDEKNGKEFFEVTFGRKEDSFREYFYLTEKAAERFVYLYNKIMDTESLPEDENGIISALTGKSIALKVGGKVNEQTGKGYPSLPYSGYGRKVEQMDELKFSNTELGKVEAAKAAQLRGAAAPSPNGAGSEAIPFTPTSENDKF